MKTELNSNTQSKSENLLIRPPNNHNFPQVASRQGLRVLDIDGVRAFLQLRVLRAPEAIRSNLKVVIDYINDPDKVVEFLLSDVYGPVDSPSVLKQYLIALSNLESQDYSRCPPRQQEYFESFKADMVVLLKYETGGKAELLNSKASERHPDLAALAACDHHAEAGSIDLIDQRDASNEFDGCCFFMPTDIDVAAFLYEKKRVLEPFQVKCKPYPDFLELASSKFPLLDWSVQSSINAKDYMTVFSAKTPAKIRAIDSHIVCVLLGRLIMSVVKTDG